jgi:ferredoxin-NADP reductase
MVDRREHGFHPLTVKDIVGETPDTISLVLDVPDDLRDLFQYQAGQFCTFRVPIDGEEVLRSYSMSSAPDVDGELTVTVKRVPGGLVSNWLHDHVSVGATLHATKPAGVFCARDSDRPIVAFCGGSGVTPVLSITKSVLAGGDRPVRVLYANRDRESVIFHGHLEELRTRHGDRLHVHHHLDEDEGFVDADRIAEFAADHLDADFFICGPTPFMDLVEATLVDLGVDPERIAIERFVNAGQAVPGAPDASASTGAEAVADDTSVPESVTLILKGTRSPTSRATPCSRPLAGAGSPPRSRAKRGTAPPAWPSCTRAPSTCGPTTR